MSLNPKFLTEFTISLEAQSKRAYSSFTNGIVRNMIAAGLVQLVGDVKKLDIPAALDMVKLVELPGMGVGVILTLPNWPEMFLLSNHLSEQLGYTLKHQDSQYVLQSWQNKSEES